MSRVRARNFVPVVIAALVAAGTGASHALAADKRPARTIGDLERRSVEVRPDEPVEAGSARAMENYRRFLELSNTDPDLRAEALRRLGDLNLESGELERMEHEVSQLDLGGAEAIELYTTLLQAYPDYPRNDEVLYQLARAYETTGQSDKALATLDDVVRRYPRSPTLDEVQFRRGEILFSAKRYEEAEAAYAAVTARGADSAFREQSLYKHGWSLFKQSRNEESLDSFGRLLDATLLDGGAQGGGAKRLESLSRADRELVEDTLRVMAITFSYLEGAASLDAWVSGKGVPPYAHLMYARLGDLYVEKERYQDAADTYRAFASRAPDSDYAPALSMRAVDAYRKGGFTELVLEGKREYVERYGFAQPFWTNRNRADHPEVVAALKTNLREVAQYHHATAQRTKSIPDYQQAARWYRDYLASFPDDPDSAATNYLLAETLFDSQQYLDAAAEYERTAYDYPRNDKSAAAAYAALVALEREERRAAGPAAVEVHARAVESGIRFADAFPEHPDSAGVLTRATEDVFEAGDLERAITLADKLLARVPPVEPERQRIAWTIIGHSRSDLGAWPEAEQAYLQARALTPPDDPLHATLTDRLAAAVYRQAEAKRAAGDALGAVDAFLRVAAVAPDSKIRSTATYDAAVELVRLESWDRAIPVLEDFRRDFPDDPLARDATRNLAVAYAKAGRSAAAAAEFERIASTPDEEPAVRREALLQAADLYTSAGDATRTAAVLERYVAEFPAPFAEAVDARQRLVELALESGDAARTRHWRSELIAADRDAGAERTDRSRYLAAQAQLALAAPARDAFRDVALTIPLKQSLAAKRKALDAAMTGYRSAADYGVAEVTSAATFEMAELYRVLARDLMASERPRGLAPDELEQYDLLLEEQAYPFEEQAIGLHEVNAARTADGLYDEGVRKSYNALAELSPGRYAKTEAPPQIASALAPAPKPALETAAVSSEDGAATEPRIRPVAAIDDTPPSPPPARAVADFDRAVALMVAGNASEAELEFGQITAAWPEYAAPWINLGILRRSADRLDESEAALRTAVERDPASAIAATELGVTLRRLGRFEDARAAQQQAVTADSAFAPAWRNLGVLLDLYLHEPDPALDALLRYQALSGTEDRQVRGWIAELRQRAGRPEEEAPPPPEVPAEASETMPAGEPAVDPGTGEST